MFWSVKYFMCIQENVYSTVIGCSVSQKLFKSTWFMVIFKISVSLLIFCLAVLCIRGTEDTSYYYWTFYFSNRLYQLLLCVFWVSVVRCTYIYNFYILLMELFFYHHIMSFFVYSNNFCLSCFCLIFILPIQLSLDYYLHWTSFPILLLILLFVYFNLKCDSYREHIVRSFKKSILPISTF